MKDVSQYNRYIQTYWKINPGATAAMKGVKDSLKRKLSLYFWPNEESDIAFYVSGRIKKPDAFFDKISVRVSDPTDASQLIKEKSDLVGVRLVVPRKNQIERALHMIQEPNQLWTIAKVEAYTNDEAEKSFFESLGLNVAQKDTGYCGIHFDVELKSQNPIRWVEIQLRTKIQDAWQSIDHILYEAEEKMPTFTMLRKSLAEQFEAAEKSQQFILEYINTEITKNELQIRGSDFYHADDWNRKAGIPKDYINKIIYGTTLACCWYVDRNLTRRTIVFEDSVDKPPKYVDPSFLKSSNFQLKGIVIAVSDLFAAGLVLGGNIELSQLSLDNQPLT